jgi:hypothetical protein
LPGGSSGTTRSDSKALFPARFHLHWIIWEERAKQCLEITSGLTSPSPFGAAANLLALQDRKGRVPLPRDTQIPIIPANSGG